MDLVTDLESIQIFDPVGTPEAETGAGSEISVREIQDEFLLLPISAGRLAALYRHLLP
jgi:hypothetical protein